MNLCYTVGSTNEKSNPQRHSTVCGGIFCQIYLLAVWWCCFSVLVFGNMLVLIKDEPSSWGWVTAFGVNRHSITSHPGQFSPANHLCTDAMTTDNSYGHYYGNNGDDCLSVGPVIRTSSILFQLVRRCWLLNCTSHPFNQYHLLAGHAENHTSHRGYTVTHVAFSCVSAEACLAGSPNAWDRSGGTS